MRRAVVLVWCASPSMIGSAFLPLPPLFATTTSASRRRFTAMCAAPSPPRRVLITGGTGFIGLNLTRALISYGYMVHITTRKSPAIPPPDLPSCVQMHTADLTHPEAMRAILQMHNWYAIIHLAALISYTRKDEEAMQKINVEAVEGLVSGVERYVPGAKVMHFSSVAAVGCNGKAGMPLVTENTPWEEGLDAVAYMRTKRKGQQLVVDAAKRGAVNALVFCPSNVYGPGDGAKSSRRTQIKAANGNWPLYTTGGVSVVHVNTVVQACINALKVEVCDDIWRGSTWLLVGDNLTIHEMLCLCARYGGNEERKPWLRLPYWVLFLVCCMGEMVGSRAFTMDRLAVATRFHWYDGEKARQRFRLTHYPAEDAIRESVQWMIEHGLVSSKR